MSSTPKIIRTAVYNQRMDEMKKQLASIGSDYDNLRVLCDKLEASEKDLKAKIVRLESSNSQLRQMNAQIPGFEETIEKLQMENVKLNREMSRLSSEIKIMHDTQKEATNTRDKALEQVQSIQSQLTASDQKIQRLTEELYTSQQSHFTLEKTDSEMSIKVADLEIQLFRKENEVNEVIESERQKQEFHVQQIEALNEERIKFAKESSDHLEQLNGLLHEREEFVHEIEQLESHLQQAELQIAAQVSTQEQMKIFYEQEIQQLEEERDALRGNNSSPSWKDTNSSPPQNATPPNSGSFETLTIRMAALSKRPTGQRAKFDVIGSGSKSVQGMAKDSTKLGGSKTSKKSLKSSRKSSTLSGNNIRMSRSKSTFSIVRKLF